MLSLAGLPVLALVSSAAQEGAPAGSILFSRDGDIWMWTGGSARLLFDAEEATDPRVAPDGSEVLYVKGSNAFSDLVLHSLATGQDTPLTMNEPAFEPGSREYVDHSFWVQDPAWSASGTIAYASEVDASDGRMALWLLRTPTSAPVLAPGVDEAGSIEGVSISADGALAAYTERPLPLGSGPTRVMLRDISDGSTFLLADDEGGVFDPAISPDGASIALSIRAANGVTDLWLIRRQTGERQQLTSGAQAVAAAWSPDGEWLAYLSPDGDRFALWATPVNADPQPVSPRHLGTFDGLDATGGLSWTHLAVSRGS